jgi:hypothetical protein
VGVDRQNGIYIMPSEVADVIKKRGFRTLSPITWALIGKLLRRLPSSSAGSAPATQGNSAAVDLPPVRHPHHVYPPLLVVHPVDRPVVPTRMR